MGNLFSSFDPQASILFISFPFNWISALISIFLIPQAFWLTKSQWSKTVGSVLDALILELSAVFGPLMIPGTSMIFLSFFMFIVMSNFMGLFPYIFTATSHFSLTLSLSIPLWLGMTIWSFVFQFNSMMAHLVPLGTPGPLMPVMVLIESISSVIRPGTLAVRLAANMVAGHLLLTLLGGQAFGLSLTILICLMVGLVLLLMLECAVACIQAYVFTILSSLYLSEVSSISFSQQMSKF